MGVNLEGHREIQGIQVGDWESYEVWYEIFASLKIRGLEDVDFDVSDNYGGLVKAIGDQFCNAV
ncbi:MAG: hypothetical protein GX117_09100 [Candidatus Hydrogenedentes bacterium]|nr:hypothetical protein [Candidatus Hydrogenedentota bacterium]